MENFNRKLALFTERCEQKDIYGNQRIRVFSVLLHGYALQFDLDSLKDKTLSIDDLYCSIRQIFETEERSRAFIQEWHTSSLSTIIAQNPTKDKT